MRKKYKNQISWEVMQAILKEYFGFWENVKLHKRHEEQLKAIYEKSFSNQPVDFEKNLYQQNEPLSGVAKRILNQIALIGWTSGSHSAGYVPVFAIGAGAEAFHGQIDNIEIPIKIAEAAGLEH